MQHINLNLYIVFEFPKSTMHMGQSQLTTQEVELKIKVAGVLRSFTVFCLVSTTPEEPILGGTV